LKFAAEALLRREDEIIEFLTEETKSATCALLDALLKSKTASPPAVNKHFEQTMATIVPPTTRPRLEQLVSQTLLGNDELQSALKDETFQTLIHGFSRMNKAGRKLSLQDPAKVSRT
jgi:hypothetical protein